LIGHSKRAQNKNASKVKVLGLGLQFPHLPCLRIAATPNKLAMNIKKIALIFTLIKIIFLVLKNPLTVFIFYNG
jgi:hypothetical protein